MITYLNTLYIHCHKNVVPFFVATAMSGKKHTNSFIMEANYYARSAVATIGVQRYTFGCLSHAIQVLTY